MGETAISDHRFPSAYFSMRIGLLIHNIISSECLLRVSANHQDNPAVPLSEMRPVTWSDLKLVLCLGDGRIVPGIKWLPPNGKKDRSTDLLCELEFSDTYGLNGPFWVLAQARRRDAWPENLDFHALTAANFVTLMGADTVELAFTKPSEPVFVRAVMGKEKLWVSMVIFHLLRKLSKHLALPRVVQTHSLRASGACWLLAAGATVKDIQDQLAHKRSGTTYRRYVANMASTNVTAAVHGQPQAQSSLLPMMDLHPNRLLEEIAGDEALPMEDMQAICDDEELVDLAVSSQQKTVGLLEKRNVSTVADLPRKAVDDVKKCYDAVVNRFNELYGQKTDRNPTTALDAFPTGEESGYLASTALNFISTFNFDDKHLVMNLLEESGEINSEEHTTLLSLAVGDSAAVLNDDWPIDPALLDPADGQADGEATATSPEAAEVDIPTVELRPHDTLKRLFNTATRDMSLADALDVIDALPMDDLLFGGFRPGHTPINGHCPFCHQFIRDLLPVDIADNEVKPLTVAHTNTCGLDRAKEKFTNKCSEIHSSHLVLDAQAACRSATAPRTTPMRLPTLFSLRPRLFDVDDLRGHMVLEHRTVIPTNQSFNNDQISAQITGPWDVMTTSVFTCFIPAYFEDEQRYIVEPRFRGRSRTAATRLERTRTRIDS